jgi:lipopolysaccharide export system protein LptA
VHNNDMKNFLLILAASLFTSSVMAAAADSSQPTKIEADQMVYDNAKQTKTFTGSVILTRGSLLIKAGKVVLVTRPSGYEEATLYAAPGKLASLRQQRDGGPDLWIEGEAERIEYNEQTEIAQLFTNAQMRRLTGKTVTDEISGEYITYDSANETYFAKNTSPNASGGNGGRVTAIIQPRTSAPKAP